jgi:ankyrin repeat protein
MSVLCRAAQFNRDECLQAFHAPDSPVNANSLNVFGQSPLYWATCYHKLEAVQLLLSLEAACTVHGDYGMTPLHAVCSFAKKAVKVQILGMLLKCVGDSVVNAQTDGGWRIHTSALRCIF